jgi:hypothetical protein
MVHGEVIMEKIKVGNAELWAEEDILMVKMSGEATSEEMEGLTKTATSMVKKHKLRYVLVLSDVVKMSLGARKAAASVYEIPMEKMAMVCGNPVTRAIAAFLMKGYKTSIQTRIFSSAEDARNWFREEGK